MSNYGIKTDTFDSRQEYVLFFIGEAQIAPASVGSGRVFQYPSLAGTKVAAFLQSPASIGESYAYAIQSCRVTYPGGIPTVTVFYDNLAATLPKADGYLTVFSTGANQ